MQYCSAAPVTRFIPHSDALLSCCQSDGHHYCDLYLSRAHPDRDRPRGGEGSAGERGPGGAGRVHGVEVPRHLAYAPNHMWLDVEPDGSCHAGLDAFFGRVVDRVDRIEPLTQPGLCRPGVMLRIHGVRLRMAFPKPLAVQRFNPGLRAEPARLLSDPYGRGWLFDGRVPARQWRGAAAPPFEDLLRGTDALTWMGREFQRMTRYIHDHLSGPTPATGAVAGDGGEWHGPVAPHLEPRSLARLFDAFFAVRVPGAGS